MKDEELIYLDTYVLQQDMRIRLPKSVLANLDVEKGKSRFMINQMKPLSLNQRAKLSKIRSD